MLKNVFLFIGEEAYLLDKELQRWKEGFVQKRGLEAIFSFNQETFDSEKVLQSIFGSGLFTSESLVVIKGLPTDNSEGNKIKASTTDNFVNEFIARKGLVPEGVWLLFVSYKPDKRGKLYKFLKDKAQVKVFNTLKSAELMLFVKEHLGTLQASDEVMKRIIYSVGDDLYRLNFELEKIVIWCEAKGISSVTQDIIDEIIFSNTVEDSFKFFAILFKDKKRCMDFVSNHQVQGANRNMFAGLVYWGLKLYISMLDMFTQGITDSKAIAEKLGINPFVLRSNMGFKDKLLLNQDHIKNMFIELVKLDYDIKTGKRTDIEFWLELKKMISLIQ